MQFQQELQAAFAALAAGEHDRALAHVREAVAVVDREPNVADYLAIGGLLERLSLFREAARCFAAGGLLKRPGSLPEWDGGSLAGQTLLVEQRIRDLAAPIRMGRLLHVASGLADKCIVLAEKRLVPLFRRSFPALDVREARRNDGSAHKEATVAASYETLMYHLGLVQFVPLVADGEKARALRRRYGEGAERVIGISWGSSNSRKELPVLADWTRALQWPGSVFVSLQYGDVAAEASALRSASGAQVIYDEEIDALADMDGYAAQVAACDAVLTVSNTAAHLAGAMGKPCVVVLDDKPHLPWPLSGERSPWYPAVRLVRRGGRPYDEVLVEARRQLQPIGGS